MFSKYFPCIVLLSFRKKLLFCLPSFEDDISDGGGLEGGLILEGGWEIDAVILTDVLDRLGRELLGFRTDPHGVKDMPTTGEVTAEGSGTDIGQASQFTFTDKTVFIVVVNHNFDYSLSFSKLENKFCKLIIGENQAGNRGYLCTALFETRSHDLRV